MFLAPANNQIDLAYDLIRSGASMFLAALCWGTTIYSSKYPRLALYAHTQGTSYGVQMIVLGLLLSHVEFVGKLTPWEVYAVWASQVVGWPMWFSQLAQSFWGTNRMNSLAAESAKAPGGEGWKENVVMVTHLAAGLAIVGWAVVVKAVLYPRV